jgi:hypothetical protein
MEKNNMGKKVCNSFLELETEILKAGRKADLKALSAKISIGQITLMSWFFSGVSIPLSRLDLLTHEFNLVLRQR